MALQGTLDTFALPDVLRLLAATRKTGRLCITSAPGSGSTWVEGGSVVGVDAPHAPHATAAVDALFELLRFEQGSFTFEPDVAPDSPSAPVDPEVLLAEAEALLSEWREIERIVPSMDAWVTLRRALDAPEVSIGQDLWTTVVAIGSGATVRHMCDELSMAELPLSRSVRDLCGLGLVDIEVAAPPSRAAAVPRASDERPDEEIADVSDRGGFTGGGSDMASVPSVLDRAQEQALGVAVPAKEVPEPAVAPTTSEVVTDDLEAGGSALEAAIADAPLPAARPLRARRAKGAAHLSTSAEPERFVPLDLPGQGPQASYDPVDEPADTSDDTVDEAVDGDTEPAAGPDAETLTAAFPSLAGRTAEALVGDVSDGPARRLAPLPSSATDTPGGEDEEPPSESSATTGGPGEGAGRGLLVKLRSSVKG